MKFNTKYKSFEQNAKIENLEMLRLLDCIRK